MKKIILLNLLALSCLVHAVDYFKMNVQELEAALQKAPPGEVKKIQVALGLARARGGAGSKPAAPVKPVQKAAAQPEDITAITAQVKASWAQVVNAAKAANQKDKVQQLAKDLAKAVDVDCN